MNDSSQSAPVRHLLDLSRDEATRQMGRAMRLRDRNERCTAQIGRTKLFLRDCDPVLAADVAQRLQRFHHDFPHVAAGLLEVNVLDLPDGAYAGTGKDYCGTYQISLNRNAYAVGRRDFMDSHVAEDYARGFHRFNVAGGTFEHELGHVLDMSLGEWGARNLGFQDAQHISGYAVHGGPEEAFADAFANYREGVSNSPYVDDLVSRIIRAARSGELVAA